jgi:hypothetical protein
MDRDRSEVRQCNDGNDQVSPAMPLSFPLDTLPDIELASVNEEDQDDEVAESLEPSRKRGRKREKSCYVWQYTKEFDPIRDRGTNKNQRQCNLCKRWFSSSKAC